MNPFGPRVDPLAASHAAGSWSPDGFADPVSASQPAGSWSPLPGETFPHAANLSAANFGERLAAHLIDQAAIFAVAWFVGRPLGATLGGFLYAGSSPFTSEVVSYVGAMLVAASTSMVFEVYLVASGWQATPGKRALGLKVTDLRNKPIGYGRAFGRYTMKGLSGSVFCMGFLVQPFTARKQALHDLLAGTLVVRSSAPENQRLPTLPPAASEPS
ncbi:MAG: RDD family protein [Bryobacterales bacterium]